jgi:hypothetical protein
VVREGPVVGRIRRSLSGSDSRSSRRDARRGRVLGLGGLLLNLAVLATAQTPSKTAAPTPTPPPAPPEAAKPAAEPIDRLPYRIRVLLAAEPEARIDERRREELIDGWLTLVRRFVGAPWRLDVVSEAQAGPLVLSGEIESLDVAPIEAQAAQVEKVWLIRVAAAGSGLVFTGREYDAVLRRLGPLQRREAPVVRDAPRVLFRFALDLFSPYAEVGARFGKDVNLIIRGASLEPASPLGRVATTGAVFQPFRLIPRKDGTTQVQEVFFTYLRVESPEPPGARCSFVSSFSDPFTGRTVQKSSYVALGVKAGKSPTRLRFLTKPDRAPAAGYVLTVRTFPDGPPREMGLTDREGRIELPSGFADGLVVVRLLAGSSEPMAEFPMVPGESSVERVVPPFDPLPLTVALETRLDSLRDAVIDVVAVRARLLARLKARYDGEDWTGAAEVLKEFTALPPRETFTTEVARLKDEAAQQQAKAKTPVLTKTAQARITDLQSLTERYLDDEEFNGFRDALDKLRTDASKKPAVATPKAAPKPATAPTPIPAPAATPAPAGTTRTPAKPAAPATKSAMPF